MKDRAYFRAYKAICEVVEKIRPLAEFQVKYKPKIKTLRLKRRDFDRVMGTPNAASVQGFVFTGNEARFLGLLLIHDEEQTAPIATDAPQTDLEQAIGRQRVS